MLEYKGSENRINVSLISDVEEQYRLFSVTCHH